MAIAHAVVGRNGHGDHRARSNGAVNDPWAHNDLAESYDRHLRRVDDAIKRLDATLAQNSKW